MKITKRAAAWLAAVTLVLLPLTAFAADGHVFDNARMLTSEQQGKLEVRLSEVQEQVGFFCGVATTDDAKGMTTQKYSNSFYDKNGLGTGEDKAGVLVVLDMDNREIYINTHGDRSRAVYNDDRIEVMLDAIYPFILGQNYYEAFMTFADEVERYAEIGVTEDTKIYDADTNSSYIYPADPKGVNWRWVAISAGIALAAALLSYGGVVARYRLVFAKDSYPFREKGRLYLTEQEDNYLHTTHTMRAIPKPSSGGGIGGGGARSSGSGGHGGGGRSF